MICKNEQTGEYYNYEFVENEVKLWQPNMINEIFINYKDWCNEYYIVDKWKINININMGEIN